MASASATIPVGYKQTEVGVIPDDWHIRSLSELAIRSRASVEPITQPHCLFTHYSIPAFDDRGEPEIVKGSTIHSSKFIVPNNAVLISKLNPRVPRIWNPKTVNANTICSTEFVVLSPVVGVERDFLELLCKSDYCYKPMKLNATGTTGSHQRISPTEVMKIKVPFTTNVVEQRSIVNAISDCSKLEQSIGKMLMKKRDIKQGTMQELLTGKTRLPGFTDEWETRNIGELVLVKTGDKDTQDRVQEGNYPFFVRSQKVERINSFSYDGEAVLTAGDGVGTGKVFHYINGKFDYHQRVYCMSDFSKIHGKYFFYQFSTRFLERVMSMTAKSSVDSVRKAMITEMKIPVPVSINEQEAIAEVLSDMDAEIAALEQRLEKTKAIKQGMMQQLLTGRIRLIDPSTPVEANE
jgi:type I restriction enzyme S subunit